MLKVKVFSGEFSDDDEKTFKADYVSLISDESFGPPALIAPKDGRSPAAAVGESVVYINTKHVPLFTIQRTEDR